jgi:hypothetical protein
MSEPSAALRETEIQRQVLDYLRLRGIPATRHQAGRVRVGRSVLNLGGPGWPDILACWRGRFLGVEVKKPGEESSEEQRRVHEQLAAARAIVLIVRSLEDLNLALRGLQTPAKK